jgi:hypothetical protein
MKAKLIAKIVKAERVGGDYILTLESEGKLATSNISAQECYLYGNFQLKALPGSHIRLGTTIHITISDENIEE